MMAPAGATVQRPYCIHVRLAIGPPAAGEARRHDGAVIEAWQVPVEADVAILLASDAIRHDTACQEAPQLVVSWAGDELLVEVHDKSRSTPVPVEAPLDAEAGRGLMLLSSLSTEWGYRETVSGKAVYFTLAP